MHSSHFAAGEQAGVFEDAEVPRDRRQRHVKGRGKIAGRGFPPGETFEHATADRIGQGRERRIQRACSMFNHQVKYGRFRLACQVRGMVRPALL